MAITRPTSPCPWAINLAGRTARWRPKSWPTSTPKASATQPEIAGPGFINLRIQDDWIIDQLNLAVADERLGVPAVAEPRTYVVDFSAPNVAKPMHVGHIRSTSIGDALSRTLRFAGHKVVTDNHIGDWGTQFGMIIYGYRHFCDAEAYQEAPVHELARLYRLVRQLMDYHDGKARLETMAARLTETEERLEETLANAEDKKPGQEVQEAHEQAAQRR